MCMYAYHILYVYIYMYSYTHPSLPPCIHLSRQASRQACTHACMHMCRHRSRARSPCTSGRRSWLGSLGSFSIRAICVAAVPTKALGVCVPLHAALGNSTCCPLPSCTLCSQCRRTRGGWYRGHTSVASRLLRRAAKACTQKLCKASQSSGEAAPFLEAKATVDSSCGCLGQRLSGQFGLVRLSI